MNVVGIELTSPWLLLTALAAVPAWWWSRRGHGRVMFSSVATLPAGAASWRTRIAWLPDALAALAVIALAVALAGPRVGDKSQRVRRDGIAMMMAVDRSTSMRALDLSSGNTEQTRLDAVKRVFERFVAGGDGLAGRPDDAIGLVGFAGYADTYSPLTLDHGNLVTAARRLEFPTQQGEDGTALGDGLALAVERLRAHPATSKVAILLTDGVETAGTLPARAAADLAKDLGIKVYTIGAGTTGMATVKVQTPFGEERRQVPVEIDEDTLRAVAERTGGAYFRATDAASLAGIYGQIDKLERTRLEEDRFLEYHEQYVAWLGAALLLWAAALLLRASVLRRLP